MTIPNQLTVARIILTPVFAVMFLSDNLTIHQWSLFVFFVAAITDWYDGWLARKFNYMSELGKFLDPLADKILISTAFLVFVMINMLDLWMVIIIIARDLVVTVLRIVAEIKKLKISTSYIAKVKTFIQMTFLYYLLCLYIGQTFPFLSFIDKSVFSFLLNHYFIYFVMLIITLLTFISGVLYFIENRYSLKEIFSLR